MEKSINKQELNKKKIEWRKKGWSIPDLRGGKNKWFTLVKNLITLLGKNEFNDLDSIPNISEVDRLQPWRIYVPFLKGMGLVINQSGMLFLSEEGTRFLNNPTKIQLANIIHEKIRLFGEILDLILLRPMTIEEVNELICKKYNLDWDNLSNIRKRMDWFEVLELIDAVGNRRWKVTEDGKKALNNWELITPDILEPVEFDQNEFVISDPPEEIATLLNCLFDSPELHSKRNTYNIWAPSPNRIENLRIIVQSAIDKITRKDFFDFICKEFNLKESSAESMLPFLKAAGYIEEVGRNIYKATPAAKAWIDTGSDLDFIRILHAHMQFVGEMIKYSENDVIRNDVYAQAKLYGLNAEKARWIAGFLIEAGLLEEPQYLHLKATPLGACFASKLPLLNISELKEANIKEKEQSANLLESQFEKIVKRLNITSKNPYAEGKAPGIAFEESIAEMMQFMGFESKRIGGSGDTDVIVNWKDNEGKNITAIIDGKSKSGGQVSHNDISDVAIDTHKDKNNADYVAIVGPHFSGNTIINHARKKNFALITTDQLIEITKSSRNLGLSLQEIALIFQTPNGFSQLGEIISQKQRELDIISCVITKFCKEQDQLGALSPRDLFLLLRDTNISPSLEELIDAFKTLSNEEFGILRAIDKNRLPENTMYLLCEVKKSVFRLRTLAAIIEKSMM